jgi:hypothetical protein
MARDKFRVIKIPSMGDAAIEVIDGGKYLCENVSGSHSLNRYHGYVCGARIHGYVCGARIRIVVMRGKLGLYYCEDHLHAHLTTKEKLSLILRGHFNESQLFK